MVASEGGPYLRHPVCQAAEGAALGHTPGLGDSQCLSEEQADWERQAATGPPQSPRSAPQVHPDARMATLSGLSFSQPSKSQGGEGAAEGAEATCHHTNRAHL